MPCSSPVSRWRKRIDAEVVRSSVSEPRSTRTQCSLTRWYSGTNEMSTWPALVSEAASLIVVTRRTKTLGDDPSTMYCVSSRRPTTGCFSAMLGMATGSTHAGAGSPTRKDLASTCTSLRRGSGPLCAWAEAGKAHATRSAARTARAAIVSDRIWMLIPLGALIVRPMVVLSAPAGVAKVQIAGAAGDRGASAFSSLVSLTSGLTGGPGRSPCRWAGRRATPAPRRTW